MNTIIDRTVIHTGLSRSALLNPSLSGSLSSSEVLSHLSETKRQELLHAVEVILASVKSSRLCLLILFGPHARKDFTGKKEAGKECTDNKETATPQSQSRFDVLAVMKGSSSARKVEGKSALHQQLAREMATPVNLVADDIRYVNRRIEKGVYFYTDLVREGVVLYDSGKHPLAEPSVFSTVSSLCLQTQKQLRKQQAQADFNHWFGKAMTFKKGFMLYFRERDYSEAAFHLHQIVERLYGAILLVFGRFESNSHDLLKLGNYTASIDPQFLSRNNFV